MDFDDFIELLTKRYGKPKNEQMVDDIRRYFFERRINYNTLYDLIVENYEYENFPNLAKIKNISNEIGSHKTGKSDYTILNLDHYKRYIEESKSWSMERLIKTFAAVRKQMDIRELKTIEISFMHYWSSLENYAGILKGKNYATADIYNMCRTVKDQIASGNDSNSYQPEDELQGQRKGMGKAVF